MREVILGITVVRLQAERGKEIDKFDEHIRTIDSLTKGKTRAVSCSGFDARTCGDTELRKGIVSNIKRLREAHARAIANPAKPGQGGGLRYLPSLIVIQNYGWGIYCDESSGVVEA